MSRDSCLVSHLAPAPTLSLTNTTPGIEHGKEQMDKLLGKSYLCVKANMTVYAGPFTF